VVDGLLVSALQPVDVAEAEQRLQLADTVAGGLGNLQCLSVVVDGRRAEAARNAPRELAVDG